MAIFYFMNWIVATKTIQGRNCLGEEIVCGNMLGFWAPYVSVCLTGMAGGTTNKS